MGFLLEHIKPGIAKAAVPQCLDHFGLVNNGSARHVDQGTLGAKGIHDLAAHKFVGRGTAGGNDHEIVDISCHLQQIGVVAVRAIGFDIAGVVDNITAEGLEFTGNGFTDTAKADNADPLAFNGGRQRRVTL